MRKFISHENKKAAYRVQASSLMRLRDEFANVTIAAATIGASEGTLQNWSANYKIPRMMSAAFAIHLEEVTEGRYKREDFRPDLFIKGWKGYPQGRKD